MTTIQWPNFNHNRSDPSVRFCATCGKVVNQQLSIRQCGDAVRGEHRICRTRCCVDCGEPLIES